MSASMAAQALSFLTFPYLTRVLGVAAYGVVAFATSFGNWPALFVDFGFSYSATRRVAASRDDAGRLAGIVADVQSAKLVLLLVGVGVGLSAIFLLPPLRAQTGCAEWALAAALGASVAPTWYLNGLEWMRAPAAVRAAQSAAVALGIFALVRHPQDAWKVLALNAIANWVVCVIFGAKMYREVGWSAPSIAGTFRALREGLSMVVFIGSVTLYTSANVFLLGLLLPVSQVGLFAAPERLVKRLLSQGVDPLSQALFPNINKRMQVDRSAAVRDLKRIAIVLGVLGGATAILIDLFAASIVRLLMGQAFLPCVPILRVAALLVPLIPVNVILGIHWLIPSRNDWGLNGVIGCAAAVNVALALVLVPRLGPVGMAWAVIGAETVVLIGTARLTIFARAGGSSPTQGAAA